MTPNGAESQLCAWAAYPEPTIAFCEARTCGFPAEPANAWSNLAYVIVGIAVLVLAKRERRWNLWPAGATAIGIGIGSFAFHAFPTFYTEYADLVSMFLLSTYLLAVQVYRLGHLSARGAVGFYAIVLTVSCASLWIHKDIGIAIFGIDLVLATGIEGVLYARGRTAGPVAAGRTNAPEHTAGTAPRAGAQDVDFRDFWLLIGFFLVSWVIWFLD